jgi:hypothetical protein
MKILYLLSVSFLLTVMAYSQVNITVDVTQNRKPVSPAIYGINNVLSDDPTEASPSDPAVPYDWSNPQANKTTWTRLKDAGIKLFRDNHGNNSTKYNWRLKLTSSPDWYNNVYGSDWDFMAQSLQTNLPGAQGLSAFQLIGKAASSSANNFNDWAYDGSSGTNASSNWAGGGGPASVGGNGGDGNINLYLKDWPADSTVKILDKWFGTGGLGLNKTTFQYWNMDNEPEIWNGTHDDVMKKQLSAENFMQNYFKVAKAARAKYPNIKLVGFVACMEWWWFAWDDGTGTNTSGTISYNGKNYTWLEFFIKRIGEEQTATGIRLLDVVDLHTYLDAADETALLQLHRIFYDKTFDYPKANGLHLLDGGTNKEYIFARINAWLDQYLGTGHGVTLGSTESGWDNFNQMPQALSYASMLGVFANEGVELFTPWYWSPSYWEVVHLFSRYSKNISVKSTSSDDNYVSAYSTTNVNNDSLTVVMVNRYTSAKTVNVSLPNFTISNGSYQVLTLSNLPADNTTVTFKSHANNALKASTVTVTSNAFTLSLPAYSINSVILKSVPKADPTITWATPASIVYGTALSATQLNATASVAGTFVYAPASGTKPNAGTQTLSVTFTPTDGATYNTVSKTVSIIVTKATPVLTWANPANIVYGTALSTTQLNATASVAGTFVYTPASGSKPNAGTQTLSVTFTPTDATNYSTATKTASIVVTKTTPVITWSNPADIVSGTALSTTQLNATASVAGTFVYTPASGSKPNAGTQTLSVTFTPTDATNYNTATKSVVINVLDNTKTNPVITWTNPANIAYGTLLSATQLNATADVAGAFVFTPASGVQLNVGTQTLSATFTPTDATKYNTVSKTVSLVVTKATPIITWANPADITAGTALNTTQLNATASVAGIFTYSPISGTKLNAGSGQSLSVTFTPTDATNYNITTKSVVINVLSTTKTNPVISWATPADITVGTALSATQLNATSNIPGTFVYNPISGTKLNAGTAQTLSVTFTPTDATTYNTASKTVKINVVTATGVGTPRNDKVTFYPNPAKDVLYFQNIPINTYVSIIDLNGKLLIDKKVENNQIYVGNLPQGVYCIKLITGLEVSILKLIKE